MNNKLKKMALVSAMACIPLLAQASPLIDSKNIDKHIDNNSGTVTIMNCAPYPLCRKNLSEIQKSPTKTTQEKTKKKPK